MKKILFSLLIFILSNKNVFAQSYPPGFSQVEIANGISVPTTFDFAPDGRIFVCQQSGELRVIKNGVLLPTPALKIDVDMNGERGLVGICVHPDFANNKWIYLYHTMASGTPKRNILSRFTFTGDVIDPASEVIILELDPLSTAAIHNSGCMRFSQDGKLFLSVGENNNAANAQNLDSYMGKILRLNPDGSVPSDNPYASGATPQRKRVWAMGLRNPFTFDINPVTGKIFINDVGHALWEEINDATLPGKNFGWPYDQGIVKGTTYTNPVFTWAHDSAAITGCANVGGGFFNPAATNYPSTYIGKYFFMDYCANWIRYIDPNVTNPVSTLFASGIPATSLSMRMGPDGNIYFLSRSTGAINKVIYSLNANPVVTKQPEDLTIAMTQSASFTVSVSGAPPFNYQWKKNGINIPGATSSTFTIPNAALTDSGKYSVYISNASGNVTSSNAVLNVINNNPPVASIVTPATGTSYKGGDVINFSGTGTDTEDGVLPASAFSWKVEFWHGTGSNQHVHDGPPIAEGVKNGSFTIPSNGETAIDVFYRLKLTVKDSKGTTNTKSVDILPKMSTLTLATTPAGLRVLLEGEPRNTSFSFQSVQGIERTFGVITPQTISGVPYIFDHWSQGGAATQTFNTPTSDATYTAVFVQDMSLRDPDNPPNVAAGLDYKYYEGLWLILPDYSTITPVKTGNVSTFNISPKNRDNNYAFRFTGYVDIATDGIYKFYSNSNDGSKLYIGDRLVVSNDGQHGNVEMSGLIGLKKGKHAITSDYFQYNGGSILTVSYSTDGLAKQEIPAAKLFHSAGGVSNNPPQVNITSPTNNQSFTSPVNITMTANASDSDGTVSKVEFYQGAVKLGEDTSSPYQYLWNNVPNGNYVLTAKAYDNQNANATSSAVNIQVNSAQSNACNMAGTITREYWTGVTGQVVSSIPVNTNPTGVEQLNIFEGPQNWADNYGARIRGYICAPSTGDYYFWISSNDNSELWLSTNDDPNNKVKIASIATFSNYRDWTKLPSQKSVAIRLVAGTKYYIEALHKEGTNSDHISVGWQLPDATLERPIPGSRLSPFEGVSNASPVVSITSPTNNQNFIAGSNISINANASDSDGSISKVEFYNGANKLGEDSSAPFQYTWNNVPTGNYVLTAKVFDDKNASTVSDPINIQVVDQTVSCTMEGTILREYWTGVAGQMVGNIPTYINPSGSQQLTIFEGPQNWGDNYGARISGYICAPVSGDYIFWISSNDGSELWLSTDDLPEHKVKIAYVTTYTNYREWTKMASQQSAAIRLEAGRRYYIEALHKEGVNSDHVSVGWQLPDGTLERPIAGSRLSPYIPAESVLQSIELYPEEENDSTYKILVYPNPAEIGYITLGILGYKGKTKANVNIIDLNGHEVYTNKIACDKTCARTLVNLDEKFTSGIYIINVEIEGKMYSKRLLIK